MKALSIKQPWAWAIVTGQKDIENRNWNTKFRGRFLVHASKGYDRTAPEHLKKGYEHDYAAGLYSAQLGGIIGSVEIVDVVEKSLSPWFQGKYGFVLDRPIRCKFKPCKGQLGFFKPTEGE